MFQELLLLLELLFLFVKYTYYNIRLYKIFHIRRESN